MKLLIATSNPGKRREIAELLAELPVELRSLNEFGSLPECKEDAPTFAADALKKARHYSQLTGLPTLADDSGLVVEALDGAPGIHSARFCGPGASDQHRVQRVLALMQGVADGRRRAAFVCALAFCDGQTVLFKVEERVTGCIAPQPAGTGGFGYDPIFFLPQLGRTMAELEPGMKNRLSHRGLALNRFREFLVANHRQLEAAP